MKEKNTMKKWFVLALLFIANIATLTATATTEEFTAAAKQAIAIEVETGKILYAKNADKPTSIASITKLLSVYLVYEAIANGELTMETPVSISDYPYQLTATGVSNVFLEARQYTVRELLHASIISSANSATIALAEKIAGSEPAFVDRMREKLNEWGVTEATIINATGLNNSMLLGHIYPGSQPDDENKLSATAIATIARRLLLDYPEVLEITSQYSYQFEGNTYLSTNQMLKGGTHVRPGVDGLKTGTTDLTGASFVSTLKGKEMRIITVVLHADGGDENPDNRFVVTNEIMDYVINKYTRKTILEKGQTLPKVSVSLFNGQKKKSPAIAKNDFHLIVEKGKEDAVEVHFQPQQAVFDAPLEKHQTLGKLTATDSNTINEGYVEGLPETELVAPKEIQAAPWPVSWWNHFVRYVNEKL